MFGGFFNAVRLSFTYLLAVLDSKMMYLAGNVEEVLNPATAAPVNSTSINVKELLTNKGAAEDGGALAVLGEQVEQYGGGVFSITQTGVIYIVGIGLLVGGGLMALHANNASKRDDDKTALYWRLAAGVLIFAAIPILVFAQKIGEAMFGK